MPAVCAKGGQDLFAYIRRMKSILISAGIAIVLLVLYKIGKSIYLRPGLVQGEQAQPIEGILADGSSFNLNQLKGQYVLLDFWGSWCGPCRKMSPDLVRLYNEFHSAEKPESPRFEIVSIAIEQNENNWRRAIQQDGKHWPFHILQKESFESPIVKAYNVKQLPTKFLIHPDGFILRVDPSMEEVRKAISIQ